MYDARNYHTTMCNYTVLLQKKNANCADLCQYAMLKPLEMGNVVSRALTNHRLLFLDGQKHKGP